MSLSSPEHLANQVIHLVESREQSFIRLNANGGNSVLVVCHPSDEAEMIQIMKSKMDTEKFQLININELLIHFVKENQSSLSSSFDLLRGSLEQIFKLPPFEEGQDFFSLIIQSILDSYQVQKIPVLINVGALYGTGIENIHIMEHPEVMVSKLPLVIIYPATHEQDKLLFLGKRPASKYRCLIIE